MAVFDGVAGVEPQSETVWRQADKWLGRLERGKLRVECLRSVFCVFFFGGGGEEKVKGNILRNFLVSLDGTAEVDSLTFFCGGGKRTKGICLYFLLF